MDKNKQNYYNKMNSSLGDKQKIIENVKQGHILEIGFGSGELLKQLEDMGNIVFGVDSSQDSVDLALEKELVNIYKDDAENIGNLFHEVTFDTIIFCSVLHEVFSYERNNHPENEPFFMGELNGIDKVINVLKQAYSLLKPDGVLIIRDGVMVDDSKENDLATFILDGSEKFILDDYLDFHFNQYMKPDFTINEMASTDKVAVATTLNNAMEFLYTYTWGAESLPREREERYGLMSLRDYKELIETLGFTNVTGYSYLQDGYKNNLEHLDFINLTSLDRVLPDSNMLIKAVKGGE